MKVRALLTDDVIHPWLNWRIVAPYKRLQHIGIDTAFTSADVGDEISSDVNILVLPRTSVEQENQEEAQAWFDYIKHNGTKLVYECDDDIFSESYVGQQAKTYMQNDLSEKEIVPILDVLEKKRQENLWTLRQCDAVTVTTNVLGSYVKTLVNRDVPIHVIPNAIDVEEYQKGLMKKPTFKMRGLVTIGWSGGRRPSNDLETMVEGWCRIAQSRSSVRFIVAGWYPPIIVDNKWLKDKLVKVPWKDVSKYASSMQVDIGCCAVSNEDFSKRKSPIKAWEYALSGAVVVASKTMYEVEPSILLADDEQDWYDQLLYLIDRRHDRALLQNMYYNHVVNHHDLATEYYKWSETYQDIISYDRKAVGVS